MPMAKSAVPERARDTTNSADRIMVRMYNALLSETENVIISYTAVEVLLDIAPNDF